MMKTSRLWERLPYLLPSDRLCNTHCPAKTIGYMNKRNPKTDSKLLFYIRTNQKKVEKAIKYRY